MSTLNVSPWFLVVLSAVGVVLSFPPAGMSWFAFIALAPLLLALRGASLRQATGLAFFFGCLHGIGVFWWLASVEGVGYPIYFLLLAPIYGLYYTIFGISYRWAAIRMPRLILLLAPALWVSVEFARANMFFLALPWNLFGHTQHAALPIIGVSDLTGVYGVSFLLVVVNETVSRWLEPALARVKDREAFESIRWTRLAGSTTAAFLILTLATIYSFARNGPAPSSDTVRVALIQPNVLVSEGMTYEDQDDHWRIYTQYTLKADSDSPDLIVWPASSLPGSIYSRAVKVPFGKLIRELNAHLLVGGSGGQKMSPAEGNQKHYANTEFFFRPGGRLGGRYNKQRLVPFNEYLPLDGVIRWPRWITTLEGNYRPGNRDTLFAVEKARFGVPICWESLFPDLFRRFVKDGANFMVNVTNEAYMGSSAGPSQTLAMNVFRAVENRVSLARVSATGISAFIGPDGRVLERVRDEDGKELFVEGILVRDIPLSKERTFYTMHGDLFAWAMIVASSLFLIVSAAHHFRGFSVKRD